MFLFIDFSNFRDKKTLEVMVSSPFFNSPFILSRKPQGEWLSQELPLQAWGPSLPHHVITQEYCCEVLEGALLTDNL